jgi:predicted MFS family arabinose efflux permease
MSFGFQHYQSATFTSWQILFLVVGLITISIGILVLFVFPDSPMRCNFLSREEKLWTIERLRANQTGIENKTVKLDQILECFTDPQTYLLSLIMITANVPNGAVSSFQATIIRGFGYDSKTTALLQLPSGAVSILSVLTATYLAGRWSQRGLNIVFQLLPGILGGCLLAFLPNNETYKVGLLIGNYLTNCIGTTIPLVYSWVGANYAGHTKKASQVKPFKYTPSPIQLIPILTDNNERRPPHLLLPGQHRRPFDFHPRKRAKLHPCENHHHRDVLRCRRADAGVADVLHVGEQAA